MTKGKYGLSLSALAILAFILCFFGFTEILILLIAYAVILEKDQWLIKQTLQALFLRIAFVVATTVVGWIFELLRDFFGIFNLYSVSTILLDINNFIDLLLTIGLFILALLAVLKLLKDQDADLPGLGKLADYTMGMVKKNPPQAQAYQAPVAPTTPVAPAYQAPVTPAVPVAPAYQAPVAPAAPPTPAYQQPVVPAAEPDQTTAETEPAEQTAPEPIAPVAEPVPPAAPTLAPGHWLCSCGRENDGNFCMFCGQPRKS